MKRLCLYACLPVVLCHACRAAQGTTVLESTRDIPVAYDVDVVVAGGSTGAVAAAVRAAQAGARVFLAAPRPYLGEDVCATYRLWLKPGEEPADAFEQALFAEPEQPTIYKNSLRFTYTADRASAPLHPDTPQPSRLQDGKWRSASNQSVQYDGDVTVTADVQRVQAVAAVVVRFYQRPGDFDVAAVRVETSADGKAWTPAGTAAPTALDASYEDRATELTVPVQGEARYLRIEVRKSAQAERILLGEIEVVGPETVTASAEGPRVPPTPMQVKRTLDQALLEAGVAFLYDCPVTEVLQDATGQLAGVVVGTRAGRQAVKAKVVIDATHLATVARLAGVAFTERAGARHETTRVVVGGTLPPAATVQPHPMPAPVAAHEGQSFEAFAYTLPLSWEDGDLASLMRMEQTARDRTWRRGEVDASERLFFVPRTRIRGQAPSAAQWTGAASVDPGCFLARDRERLWVLGGCADVSAQAAAALLRPLTYIATGRRVGALAAEEASGIASLQGVTVHAGKPGAAAPVPGQVRDDVTGAPTRGRTLGTVPSPKRHLPVLGSYDVVVVGGGTGGAPAGIAAARLGAKTLVIEYLCALGGIGTQGLITKYYHGNRVGFTTEIDEGLGRLGGPDEGKSAQGQAWDPQLKSEWFRRELRQAGADIWYGTLGCGALTQDGKVTGVVVATELGRGVVLARTVIDATGHAGIAAAAGAPCIYTGPAHIAVQGTGLPPRQLGVRYTNTDYTFVDDLDAYDTWRVFLTSKEKFAGAYDLGQLIDTRERRQIRGDIFLTPSDAYMQRTFPDTIVMANSNFDTHGFTIHPMFMLRPPDRRSVPTYIPYRCLLPQGLEGILVTGLGVSAHRDVMPVIRMQPDIQNQGYAAGAAAAMAVAAGVPLRGIDIRQLQQHLVKQKILAEEVLNHGDSFPPDPADLAQAVRDVVHDFNGLEVLFAQPERSRPLLRAAYDQAERQQDKLTYAHILAFFGDDAGTPELIETVQANAWDEGWSYRGMGQFGRSISALDSLIIALGCTGRAETIAPLVEKIEPLGPEHPFSHHRAVAMAAEMLADPAVARALATVLRKPGMTGHAFTDITIAQQNIQPSRTDNSTREQSLRELVLARALYRCGDYEGVGQAVLEAYAQDLRGHYRRHAQAILAGKD
jgi:flavin-dependent dehydrogenase